MNFYVSVLPETRILHIIRYTAGQAGKEGSVMKAKFAIGSQVILCTDSVIKHAFTFTPSISLWLDCESEEEVNRLARVLSDGGYSFMAPGNYGFSRQFAWVGDKFGVTWQLNFD